MVKISSAFKWIIMHAWKAQWLFSVSFAFFFLFFHYFFPLLFINCSISVVILSDGTFIKWFLLCWQKQRKLIKILVSAWHLMKFLNTVKTGLTGWLLLLVCGRGHCKRSFFAIHLFSIKNFLLFLAIHLFEAFMFVT